MTPTGTLTGALNDRARTLAIADRLALARQTITGRFVFTTSFGLEDQLIAHVIFSAHLDVDVVTLDTGRLFPETYALWADTERRYGRRIQAYSPRHEALERYVAVHGINGFYASPQARLSCCDMRKVEPLGRALLGAHAWVTGLRGGQSAERSSTCFAEYEEARAVYKLNPLFDQAYDAVMTFIAREAVPHNPLHARGFISIGCAPCTRAVQPGEPERAGRWWWETESKQECGLHLRGARPPAAAAHDRTEEPAS
jgi:phosphoadenosine phosphosulfate reductase